MEVYYNFKFISILLIVLLPSLSSYSQDDRKFYSNTNLLELVVNNESQFSNGPPVYNEGFSFEINSFHGIYFLKYFLISAGVGINLNYNEFYKMLPITIDLKYFFNEYGENSPYINLNIGKGLDIGSFSEGQSSKLGIGLQLDSDFKVDYVIEVFYKVRDYYSETDSKPNYATKGVGLSLGLNF